MTGVVEGGWPFVWAAYGITAVILIGYAVSLHRSSFTCTEEFERQVESVLWRRVSSTSRINCVRAGPLVGFEGFDLGRPDFSLVIKLSMGKRILKATRCGDSVASMVVSSGRTSQVEYVDCVLTSIWPFGGQHIGLGGLLPKAY